MPEKGVFTRLWVYMYPGCHLAGCERKRCSEAERAERARAQGKLSLTLMLARAFKAFGSFRQVRIFSASVEGVGYVS